MATGISVATSLAGSRNAQLKSNVDACLGGSGFTPAEIAQIEHIYTDCLDAADITIIAGEVQLTLDNAESQLVDAAEAATTATTGQNSANSGSRTNDPQDAARPIIKPDNNAIGAAVTSPPKFPAASSDRKDGYPEGMFMVLPGGGWLKVNPQTGLWEFCHQSGARYQIDQAGNGSIYYPGSVKQIIGGDYTLDVRGNMDIIVGGDRQDTVRGSMTWLVTAALEMTTNAIAKIKATLISLN